MMEEYRKSAISLSSIFFCFLVLLNFQSTLAATSDKDLLLVTVANDATDGFRRFLRSTKLYGVKTKVFGMGEPWLGGNMEGVGGGYKINLLKAGLEEYKDRDDLIIMFTDRYVTAKEKVLLSQNGVEEKHDVVYIHGTSRNQQMLRKISFDVVLTAGVDEILEKFLKFDARVVFSAEPFCWPDKSLMTSYPEVKANEKRFLCSGGFIGYAKDVYDVVTNKPVSNSGDDQLYYTQIFLDPQLQEKWNMKLDKKSEIFMNLHGALGEIMLKFKGSHSFLYNIKTGTVPIVLHGNGPIKPEFNRLANYLADSWTSGSGCLACNEDLVSLEGLKDDDFPTVLMGIFVEMETPFITEFFQKVEILNYPKNRIDLLIHNTQKYHQKDLAPFLEKNGLLYKSVNIINPSDNMNTALARNWALEECLKRDCQYFFNVDSDVHIDNADTLQLLIQQNRSVIAPQVNRPEKMWSNFWGALSTAGFYARSEDYMDIVEHEKLGLWNVPYMTGIYLIQGHVIPSLRDGYLVPGLDQDMALCQNLREKGHFMMLTNMKHFGHLVDAENFDTSHAVHAEMWELFNNPHDWAERYIHPNYSQSLQENAVIAEPCPDVFWFPFVSDAFCEHMIAIMEDADLWSGGKSQDSRLDGGYENVPTDDVHFTQIGLQNHWLEVLRKYVMPLTTKVFQGYYSDPPRAILNFVVKYHPDRQKSLRPHHDSSTFTTNIALNTPNVDYEGGGCRFLRYNCGIVDSRKGWLTMHPGRLTHFHEGLLVTKGTRYILVSFVDP